MDEKYQKLRKIVEEEMKEASPLHDISHSIRVYSMCLYLAQSEPDVDLDVLRTSALLHDIAKTREDKKGLSVGHALIGAAVSEKILRELEYPEEKIEHIKHCISAHSFGGKTEARTKEAKILSDADKLDLLGAIGIARAFTAGGQLSQKIYSDTPVKEYLKENLVDGKSDARIMDSAKHTANLEFETKIKHIPDKLYTQQARKIARQRLEFMKQFFDRLKREIDGEL